MGGLTSAKKYEKLTDGNTEWESCTQADVKNACGYGGLSKCRNGHTVMSQWGSWYRRKQDEDKE